MIGKKMWAIAEGWIPPSGIDASRALRSHETACILNAGFDDAVIIMTAFFADNRPIQFEVRVDARRSKHIQFNDYPIPHGTDFSVMFESNVPIVVQHTRLDSRMGNISLMTTTAYSE